MRSNRTRRHSKREKVILLTTKRIGAMLVRKNRSYGDSVLSPIRVFSKADSLEQLKVRIDDKLSRIARGQDITEDTISDLIGYLIMLKIGFEH